MGFELSAKMSGAAFEIYEKDPQSIHTCWTCLGVDIIFKAELGGTLKFLNSERLSVNVVLPAMKIGLGSIHKSSEDTGFKEGKCKNLTYRITTQVLSPYGVPVKGARVSAGGETLVTDRKGCAVFYLTNGTHTISAENGTLNGTGSVDVTWAQKVRVWLSENAEQEENTVGGVLGTVDTQKITNFSGALQYPLMAFNGHTYTLFDGKAATWEEAQAYCESMGAHLATITSQEENDFLYYYMTSSGYQNAYWGLTDREEEGVWKWCTGEPLTYTNWASGEPSNTGGKEHDGMFYQKYTDGSWNDSAFGASGKAFLCEWDYPVSHVFLDDGMDNEYLIVDQSMTWEEAKAYCETLGGHLATVTAFKETKALVQILRYNRGMNCYWIGLHRENVDASWQWITGEPFVYTNWASGEPNNDHNMGETCVHVHGKIYTGGVGTKSYGHWNDVTNEGAEYASAYYALENFGFICEFESSEDTPWGSVTDSGIQILADKEPDTQLNAVYPGDYGAEFDEAYTLHSASFEGLVPEEQYVLLAMKSIEVADPLAADNLLFIDQAAAWKDGTLRFEYVQRETAEISYVVACGASNKDLNDAQITFPEMVSDGELQVVDPTVVYDGVTLTEGLDYTIVGTVDYTTGGTYTCYIRGIRNYTGLVACEYTVAGAEVASGWSGATTWVLTDDGVITFTGSGNMKNYGYTGEQPWAEYADRITAVVIEDGVTAIGSGAFRNMTKLESVTLPAAGLTKIGEAAFYGCSALKQIHIPDGVYTIWAYTFKNCPALTAVRLPATLIKVDQGAFEACTGLTELFIPGNTEIIGAWSFKGCSGLTAVDMQWADATEIRAGAFKNCTALTDVILPPDIQILGDSAFYGVGAESFTIPATVTEVGPWCFARAALREVTFLGDAPAIGEGVFNKITLTACYPADNATWTADMMHNYGGSVTWKAQ